MREDDIKAFEAAVRAVPNWEADIRRTAIRDFDESIFVNGIS
jgi:hypothetical protein